MKVRMLVAALGILAGAAREGRAQVRGDAVDALAAAPARPVRPMLSTGFALALSDYETHGIAFPVRAGADLPMFRTGPLRHHLLLAVEYAHFSRAFVTEPEPLPGVQLDVGTLAATWRVFPFPGNALHVSAGTGVSVLHDRIRVALPDRRFASSETRVGLPLEIGLGWLLWRHLDLGFRYSHVVLVTGEPSAVLGRLEFVVGGRL
jgi:hypothetical protein